MDAVRLDLSSAARTALKSPTQGSSAAAAPIGKGFGEQLAKLVGEADSLITKAEKSATDLASGKADSVDTIIAMSKADLALRHVVTLRNRALEAYQEIMRLPL